MSVFLRIKQYIYDKIYSIFILNHFLVTKKINKPLLLMTLPCKCMLVVFTLPFSYYQYSPVLYIDFFRNDFEEILFQYN